MNAAQRYAKGLLVEECGEALQAIGKADRFGIDTPGPEAFPYHGRTAREQLQHEAGDILAAVEYAIRADLLDGVKVHAQREAKLAKLLDHTQRDNLGRRLAPDPFGGEA